MLRGDSLFMTECSQTFFPFEAHCSRLVEARFDGSAMTSDGGALLLRAVDKKIRLLQRVVVCFTDGRDAQRLEHELSEMLAQRIYGLALGYEDLNDHEVLRHDPLLGVLAGKREREQPLAGKSTLNRLELTPAGEPEDQRYHKITYSSEALDAVLVDVFLHQGTTQLVQRSAEHGNDACQPTAPVLFVAGLRAGARAATASTGGKRVGQRPGGNHPPTLAEDRRRSATDGTAHPGTLLARLSMEKFFPCRSRGPERLTIAAPNQTRRAVSC